VLSKVEGQNSSCGQIAIAPNELARTWYETRATRLATRHFGHNLDPFVTSNDTVSSLIGGLDQRFHSFSINLDVGLSKRIKQFIVLNLPASIHVNLVKKLNERRGHISGGAAVVYK
jgi:hypothetical protein